MTFLPTDSGASERSRLATPVGNSWVVATPSTAMTFLPTDSGASERSRLATPAEDSRPVTTPSPAMTFLPTDSGASERSRLATPVGDSWVVATPSPALTFLPTDGLASKRSQLATPMGNSRHLTTPLRYERFPDHAASPESVGREDESACRRRLFFEEMSFEEDLKCDKNPCAKLMRHRDEDKAFLSQIEDFQLDFSALADDSKPGVTGPQSSARKSTEAPTIGECLGHEPSEPSDRRRLFRLEIAAKYHDWVHNINQPEGVSEFPPCEF